MTTNTLDLNAMERLSPEKIAIIQSMIQQMTGLDVLNKNKLALPSEGITLWKSKLKQERYSPRTIQMYSYFVERYLKENPKPTKLDIQSYLAEKLESGMSPAAVENTRKSLHSLFKFLHEEGLWNEDPTHMIRRVKVSYSSRPCPTPEEVQKVFDIGCYRSKDTDKLRTFIQLLSTTGLRLGEACSLKKDAINFEALELRILGKGEKLRIVPLLPSTAKLLKRYIRKHTDDSPFVFTGRGAGGHAQIYNFEKTLLRACKRAGVRLFSPHGLRHFYATEMLKNGAKLEVVGRILGHASIGVTADIYRHVRTSEIHEEHLRYAPTGKPAN